jgi:septal ring factor EnvC (AmiA/AmiB activator)
MILVSFSGVAQNKRKVLEQKKNRLKSDIAYKNTLLKKTEKEKKSSLNRLILIEGKISKRQELIATMSSEIKLINQNILENQELIASMERDVKALKEEYARMIQFAYRNRSSYDKIMYIFASDNFNQAYKRVRFLQQYSAFRIKQTEDIARLEEVLKQKNADLLAERAEKETLIQNQKQEQQKLAAEKNEQQQTFASLQSQEEELRKEIKAKQKEQEQLQLAIKKAIEEEISLAQKKSGNKGGWALTPEATMLANSFNANKGKLPWPVENGTITDRFGVHAHPVLKNLKVRNNGVGISTNEGASARAVFDGTVLSINIIPGSGKAVMISHGNYISVYGNLKEVYVAKGDVIKRKQILGVINTDKDKTELQFEIWNGNDLVALNPSLWLYKAQ